MNIKINKLEKIFLFSSIIVVLILLFVFVIKSKDDIGKKILSDLVEIQKYNMKKPDDYKADFIQKCLLARQVYQYNWWKTRKTKIGSVYVDKKYAMSLEEYNKIIEMSWDLNRLLSVPLDSWENYIMLAKWILESSICPYIEHKTGEIIKMTGYTKDGAMIALFHYKYEMNIKKGHKLYIPQLFDDLSIDDLTKVFEDIDNVIKFDYSYILFLMTQYDYRWDWVLTSFHFGEGKTLYWKDLGLKSIPNYRLDGKWAGYYLREYYQSIYEIAQGISIGNLTRISRWEEIISMFKKHYEWQKEYVATIRLKVNCEEKTYEMEEKYKKMFFEFGNYKKINEELLNQMAKLNDLNLDYKREFLKSKKKKIFDTIMNLKKKIIEQYEKLHNKNIKAEVKTNESRIQK